MDNATLVFVIAQYGIFALILISALAVGLYSRQKRRRVWGELAAQFGLALERGSFFTSPRVTGTYRSHEITLDTFSRGSGKSRTTYTRIVVFADNQAGVSLAIYQEGLFGKIGKFFGQEDVQVGDEEIDRRFIIKCRPETFAARLMTSISLRQKLLEAKSVNVEVDGREVRYTKVGVETNPETLRFLFDLTIDLAEVVERA